MSSECLTFDYTKSTQLTDIELQILQQYQALARRLADLSETIAKISQNPTQELLENVREIEGKISLVYTLFNAAVYSLFLQRDNQNKLAVNPIKQLPSDQSQREDVLQESTQSFIS